MRQHAMRRSGLVIAPLLLLALGLGGCAIGTHPSGSSATSSQASAGAVVAVGLPRSVPVSIDIPKINAQSTLLSLGLAADQTVALPPTSTPMQASWFNGGPTPGEIGPAAIFGHVDGNHEEGIFFRLHELVAGDLILIKRQDGSTATFRVSHTEEVAKDSFPTDAVYGDTNDAELRLITCGGSFDQAAHSYRNNIIVFASLVTNPA